MFRFTIRDVLWLIVVVAISASWFADHWRMASILAKNHQSFRELLHRYNELSTAVFS